MEILNIRLDISRNRVDNLEEIWGLAKKCDWFIHIDQVINLGNTQTPKTIFLYTKEGEVTFKFFIYNILPNIKNTFNLIIGGDDYTFPSGKGDVRKNLYKDLQHEIQNILFLHPFLNKIFIENLDTVHPKCIPIPLGLLKNSKIDKYAKNYTTYENCIEYMPLNISSKEKLVMYCNINRDMDPQFLKRRMVRDVCRNEWSYFVDCYDDVSYENVISEENLKSMYLTYKFCLCLPGGGLDPCPKIWQALLCGCIPVIEHSTMDKVYERFPVMFIDSWNPPFHHCISPEILNQKFEELRPYYEDEEKRRKVLEMLTLDYWWKLVSHIPESKFIPEKSLFVDICSFNSSMIFKKEDLFLNKIDSLEEKTEFSMIYRSSNTKCNWSILHTKHENYIQKKEDKIEYVIDEKNNRFNEGGECLEDPRFFVMDNTLYVIYSQIGNFYNYPEVKQYISPADDFRKKINLTGVNLYIDKYNVQIEKNWSFFQVESSKKVYMVYSFLPTFILYEVDKLSFHASMIVNITFQNVPQIRGGTTPIEIDNKLYFFGHSMLPNFSYLVSLIIVDVNTLTIEGYIQDCVYNKYEFDKNLYFCRGAVYVKQDDLFIISCGADDIDVHFLHFSKKELDQRIINIV
jgi:hypothetical protein